MPFPSDTFHDDVFFQYQRDYYDAFVDQNDFLPVNVVRYSMYLRMFLYTNSILLSVLDKSG